LLSTLKTRIAAGVLALALIGSMAPPVAALADAQDSDKQRPRGNTYIDQYMKANWDGELARGIPYPSRTKPAVLYGSWFDMGRQYGKAFGKYVRIVYDANYGLFLNSQLPPEKLGPVLDKYMDETGKLSPEMVEFVKGIGTGAAPELNGADHAAALTNTQKVMLVNCLFEVVIPPAWSHVAQMMNEPVPAAAQSKAQADFEPFASHAWATWGNMTRGHTGIMGGTRDQPWMPTLYNVSYVAVPSDRKAGITWGNAIAGHVASSSQVNEYGVGLGNTIVSHKTQYFGVPALLTTAYISFFAHSARQATDMLTVGTPEYRQKTGRKTLAYTVGFFQVFADTKEAFTVERTGRHYAVRTAGTQGERGDYTVLANHAVAANSYDEFAKPTDQPMENWTIAPEPDSSSLSRYWALFYEFRKNKGRVDQAFGQDRIATMKHTYTADGKLVTTKDGLPVWRLGLTPERWLIPNPADPDSFPTGGNNMYFVADLKKRDISWVQGIPSHWSGKWEQISLKDGKLQCLRWHHNKQQCGIRDEL